MADKYNPTRSKKYKSLIMSGPLTFSHSPLKVMENSNRNEFNAGLWVEQSGEQKKNGDLM